MCFWSVFLSFNSTTRPILSVKIHFKSSKQLLDMINYPLNPFSNIFDTPGNSKITNQEFTYAIIVACTIQASWYFFSCTNFLPRAVLLIKKLKIDKNKPTCSYQYSKLYTRWPQLSQIPTFSLRKLLREGNQIWYTCNSPTFGNIGNICYSKKFFQAGEGRWSF